MPGGVAGERPVKAVPYADRWESSVVLRFAFVFHQAQAFVAVGADLVVQRSVGFQGLLTRREDFLELGSPNGAGFFREAAFDQLEHDRNGDRSTWRGAQQGGQAAVLGCYQFGTELQHTAFFRVFLDDLHALAGNLQAPVLGLGLWIEATQGIQALLHGLHRFAHQVLGQVHVVASHGQHRANVGGTNRHRQVKERAMLEELGGETGVWPEQQGSPAFDDAGVQVRHRHGRRTDRCLAVDLGLVLLDHFRVVATQPLAADREAAKALAFFDTRQL
ncbi:hypothetical protein D3C85_402580 [compost metagenome]